MLSVNLLRSRGHVEDADLRYAGRIGALSAAAASAEPAVPDELRRTA